jgi:Ca2+-binding EF-hand superfamily protein
VKPTLFLLPVALLASCATTSTTSSAKAFQRADKDSSGTVTRQEAADLMIGDAFNMFDSNGDGFVDQAEFVASGGKAENFSKLNRSGTGKLTLEEAKANPTVFNTFAVSFDEADTDKDGSVSYEDYLSYLAKRDAAVR